MSTTIVFVVVAVVIVAALLYRNSPKFRNKANKYVDKNGNGKPFG